MDWRNFIRPEDQHKSEEFFQNPGYVHYIGMFIPPRPGVRLCAVKLEYTYFKPGTPRNDQFFFRLLNWLNVIWTIVSIPKEDAYLMEEVSSECGLRIVNGVPRVISAFGVESFPIDNDNIFTLENAKDHLIYTNDPKILDFILEEEQLEIGQILESWERRQ